MGYDIRGDRDSRYVAEAYPKVAPMNCPACEGRRGDETCDSCFGTGVVPYDTKNAPADLVNHPPHYTSHPSGVEAITITEHFNFNLGNAIKYIWRAGLKDGTLGVEDLKKAAWYVEREIKRMGG